MKSLNKLSAILVSFALAGSASAALNTGSENVSGTRTTPAYGNGDLKDNAGNPGPFGPYSWDYSYTRSFDGNKLVKDIEIDFSFDAALGYTDAQKADYKKAAEAAVEGVWNNKYAIKDTATGKLIPIIVDITLTGPFNQKVQVHKGPGRADMTNWYTGDSASVNAHEVGHMMGLYDEYIGGAVDKYPGPTLSDDGLMGLGALSDKPVMYSRYYQQYYDYIKRLNPDGSFILTAVPEPSQVMLFVVGLMLVGVYAQKRKT